MENVFVYTTHIGVLITCYSLLEDEPILSIFFSIKYVNSDSNKQKLVSIVYIKLSYIQSTSQIVRLKSNDPLANFQPTFVR